MHASTTSSQLRCACVCFPLLACAHTVVGFVSKHFNGIPLLLISVMEGSSAANAARWWKEAVDCGPNNEADMHALCLAAVESALFVHALQISGLNKVHTPERPQPVQEWASEIEVLVHKVMAVMQCGNYGYYNSLLHTMLGRLQASDEAWTEYTSL